MFRRIANTLVVLSALLTSNQLLAQLENSDESDAYERALQSWELVLERYVDTSGRTDFIALAEDSGDLRRFVDFLESTGPSSHPALFNSPEKILAYHINAYNALAMLGVIERGIPEDFDSFFKRAGFFKFRSVVVAGKKTSLYDYENKVIRPLGDARAHFALNCMVRDCPRLPMIPFRAESLNEQLEQVSWEFFSKQKHLRIDDKKRTIYVSAILDFYTEDFVASGKPRDLPSYINTYLENPLPLEYKVKFIDYDWTINQRPKS